MAKFKTLCPLCQAEIHVYSQWAGQLAVCPSCSETITVPTVESSTPDAIPRITTCPSCRSTQIIPAEISDRSKRTCTKCGCSFLYMPDISFKCADKLPPDQNGNARIACPYCGRHYVLKFSPHNNLIGCQECMNIFATPDAVQNQSVQKKMPRLIPTPLPTSAPIPIPIPIQPRAAIPVPAENSVRFSPKTEVVNEEITFQQPDAADTEANAVRKTVVDNEITLQQPVNNNGVRFPQAMPVLQLQPAFPDKTQSDDQDEEMVTIQHRTFNEPQTIALSREDTSSEPQTVTEKSLLRKFFGN